MTSGERCPECGSWGVECGSEAAVAGCGCARCLRQQLAEARETLALLRAELADDLAGRLTADGRRLDQLLEGRW